MMFRQVMLVLLLVTCFAFVGCGMDSGFEVKQKTKSFEMNGSTNDVLGGQKSYDNPTPEEVECAEACNVNALNQAEECKKNGQGSPKSKCMRDVVKALQKCMESCFAEE